MLTLLQEVGGTGRICPSFYMRDSGTEGNGLRAKEGVLI